MSGSTRAEFLTRGAKGGVALVAGGSVLALAQGSARRCNVGRPDRQAGGDRGAACAVPALRSNELKAVAAEIGACESRHLSVLSNIAANQIVPVPDLPKVLTAKQALAAVQPFLA